LDYGALATELRKLRENVAGVTDTALAASDGIPILTAQRTVHRIKMVAAHVRIGFIALGNVETCPHAIEERETGHVASITS
jgi:predicted regulator of Ras-like GTPase activity (Roadblock/LC7/MglB family)